MEVDVIDFKLGAGMHSSIHEENRRNAEENQRLRHLISDLLNRFRVLTHENTTLKNENQFATTRVQNMKLLHTKYERTYKLYTDQLQAYETLQNVNTTLKIKNAAAEQKFAKFTKTNEKMKKEYAALHEYAEALQTKYKNLQTDATLYKQYRTRWHKAWHEASGNSEIPEDIKNMENFLFAA